MSGSEPRSSARGLSADSTRPAFVVATSRWSGTKLRRLDYLHRGEVAEQARPVIDGLVRKSGRNVSAGKALLGDNPGDHPVAAGRDRNRPRLVGKDPVITGPDYLKATCAHSKIGGKDSIG